MAAEKGYRGIHLDFEYLPPEDSEKLGVFSSRVEETVSGENNDGDISTGEVPCQNEPLS